jgi:catechol 2,3-dioxygenase-like lactoylglutathione lyase family enzyme
MSTKHLDAATTALPWSGFHHVALATPDLDETIRFYGGVLGMLVGKVFAATEQQGRHCFVRPGEDVETWGMHFFEHPDAQLFAWPEGERFAFVPGALQHVAFALPGEEAALALRRRLEQLGTEVSPSTNLGRISNMLFRDNNGLLLEATWPNGEG